MPNNTALRCRCDKRREQRSCRARGCGFNPFTECAYILHLSVPPFDLRLWTSLWRDELVDAVAATLRVLLLPPSPPPVYMALQYAICSPPSPLPLGVPRINRYSLPPLHARPQTHVDRDSYPTGDESILFCCCCGRIFPSCLSVVLSSISTRVRGIK
jgi:hypothetical protein